MSNRNQVAERLARSNGHNPMEGALKGPSKGAKWIFALGLFFILVAQSGCAAGQGRQSESARQKGNGSAQEAKKVKLPNECDLCTGTGKVRVLKPYQVYGTDPNNPFNPTIYWYYVEETCTKCNGSGKAGAKGSRKD